MNYRHSYHAGNFADVLKHVVLTQVVEHLCRKPKPFRLIDTHAGIGRYNLESAEATKTREWEAGVGRIFGPKATPLPPEIAAPLAGYLSVLKSENPDGVMRCYPGSPWIARRLLRPQDHLLVNELHSADSVALRRLFARDAQTTVTSIDGWSCLKATLPPPERRGLVLVDPPFEQPGEFERLTNGLAAGVERFSTGVYLLWFPIKDPRMINRFYDDIGALGLPKTVLVELLIRSPVDHDQLNGCGLIVLNPPYGLAEALKLVLPFLADRLAVGRGANSRLDWLVPE